MARFVGRKAQLQQLNEQNDKKSAAFVAVK